MFGNLGAMEIGIIVAVVLIVFGPSQIPKLGRSMGQTIREFRKVGRELQGVDGAGEDPDDDWSKNRNVKTHEVGRG